MKKNNKKGFTIIELVIVIGVIAILAGVLIPTFASVTEKARVSAALQQATNALKVVVAEDAESFKDETYYIKSGNYWFKVENGDINTTPVDETTFTLDANDVVYAKEATGVTLDSIDFASATVYEDLGAGIYVVKQVA